MNNITEQANLPDLANNFVQQHCVIMNSMDEPIGMEEWVEAPFKIAVPIIVDDYIIGTLFYASHKGGRKGIVQGLTRIIMRCISFVRNGHSLRLFNSTGSPSLNSWPDSISSEEYESIKKEMSEIVGKGIMG